MNELAIIPTLEKSEKLQLSYDAYAILDLDGVITRYASWLSDTGTSHTFTVNRKDQIEFFKLLELMDQKRICPLILTNRPPGQMQGYASAFGLTQGIIVTESGGSAYNVARHKIFVTPKFVKYAHFVANELRPALERELNIVDYSDNTLQAQYEPGKGYVKTVLIPPEGITPQTYLTDVVRPFIDYHHWGKKTQIKSGKAVDIDPPDLSKSYGMEVLLDYNGVRPQTTPTIWIADEQRDINAAAPLVRRGGHVAAVGNATDEYKEAVRRHNGIIATSPYHAGVVDIMHAFIGKYL